ncbi:MAG: translation initiation factor [Rickettsiaceae bacterium]|nr:translation initiation factor [Rickettsiaceae bacterium]
MFGGASINKEYISVKQVSGKGFRINDQIKVREVRLINENGDMVGVTEITQAIKMAIEAGLDLVEVSPNAEPPVCKIANFGKMKYEIQKKAADAKKKQKVVETKEVKLSINIGKGDYDVKIKQIIKFIEKGDKVKISIKIKGREMTHLDLAEKMMTDITNDISEFAKFEATPRMEGKQMVALAIKK